MDVYHTAYLSHFCKSKYSSWQKKKAVIPEKKKKKKNANDH